VEALARTITSNRAHSEDLEPTIQLQILVGELPVHVDFHFILVLRASSGRVDLEIVSNASLTRTLFFPAQASEVQAHLDLAAQPRIQPEVYLAEVQLQGLEEVRCSCLRSPGLFSDSIRMELT